MGTKIFGQGWRWLFRAFPVNQPSQVQVFGVASNAPKVSPTTSRLCLSVRKSNQPNLVPNPTYRSQPGLRSSSQNRLLLPQFLPRSRSSWPTTIQIGRLGARAVVEEPAIYLVKALQSRLRVIFLAPPTIRLHLQLQTYLAARAPLPQTQLPRSEHQMRTKEAACSEVEAVEI